MTVLLALAWPSALRADLCYYITNQTVIITGYDYNWETMPADLVIPGEIEGWPVVGIDDSAFASPSDVLTNLTLPDSLISIGPSAFYNCWKLPGVKFGPNLTSIGDAAFAASGLTNVVIPASVTNLGTKAFGGCDQLTNITVEAANPKYVSVDGKLFNKERTELLLWPGGITNSFWPGGVTSIGDSAFSSCLGLLRFEIPNGVTNIGANAFSGCLNLTNVSLPSSVNTIGESAFANCQRLTALELPNGLSTISDNLCASCSALTNMVIPESVKTIGIRAFDYCYELKAVSMGNGVMDLKDRAFGNCSHLLELRISQNVTNLGEFVFGGCSQLATVEIPDSVLNIGAGAFYFCTGLTNVNLGKGVLRLGQSLFLACPLTTVKIPNQVVEIGRGAFLQCNRLTNVIIGTGVTNIAYGAFYNCPALQQVCFVGDAPNTVDSTAFGYTTCTVYYLPGAQGWGTTLGDRPTAWWCQPQPQILDASHGLGMRGNAFQFTIYWATNTEVTVEMSTDLRTWTPVVTNALASGTNGFGDPTWSAQPQRFYRVRGQ